jgi:WD40 repeat protein/serine/threonine protein kinase
MNNLSGKTIKGYELHERIGAGGFGAVYRAYQSTMGREVAVKIILPGFANQPDFIRRFEAEARLVARLEHLHIVPLYDYWRDPDGAYLVMRWLRGGSLRDALEGGPFSLENAAFLLDQVASALAVAHANGIIHRDLKTSNILLDEEGNAYLADFGIAKNLKQPNNAISNDEQLIGSLSPEQARNQPVTPQTDIYSLGITLYEILMGTQPFPGSNLIERLYKHINDPIPLIETLDSHVQEGINEVIQRATAKDPKNRYEDVLAMAVAFQDAAKLSETGRATDLLETLTLREQEILRSIVNGLTNRQIAQDLYVELSTVKWHIRQIYGKLGVRSRKQAVVRARELELLMRDVSTEHTEEVKTGVVNLSALQPVNPYKGLRAFETADSRDFFGREEFLEKLIDRLAPDPSPENTRGGERFLAIVGPSGGGKSSLVNAGLIPALWEGAIPGSDRWFIVQMVPGSRPLDELEVALLRVAADQADNIRGQLERDQNGLLRSADLILPRDDSELVLVIDQFEEVFTLVSDEASRAHFLGLLTAAVTDRHSRVRIVITLRADYYDRPLHYPEFGQLIRNHLETVLPLSAEELERVILSPAENSGVTFESGLVARIIDDVLYQPGALPLLQYALTELFEGRDGRTLTRSTYEGIGGAAGALARRAEELYREQDSEGREALHQMFLRLVVLDDDSATSPASRKRVARSELIAVSLDKDLMEELIDAFAAYRLLTLDHNPNSRRPTVEIAHEALLGEWQRLRDWLDDSRDDLRLQRQLGRAAAEWQEADKDPSFALRGTRLAQFETWSESTNLALSRDELDYLQSSIALREKEQVRQEKRRKQTIISLASGLVIAIILVLIAGTQWLHARQLTRNATARELAAASLNNLDVDPELSILLALAAVNETYTTDHVVLKEAEEALHRAVQESKIQARISLPDESFIHADFNKDGTRLYTFGVPGSPGNVRIWDANTGELVHTLQPGIAFKSIKDENLLVGLQLDFQNELEIITVWNFNSGEIQELIEVPMAVVEPLTVKVDEYMQFYLRIFENGETEVWDLNTVQRVFVFGNKGDTPIETAAISKDGKMFLAGDSDGVVKIWSLESGENLLTLPTESGWIYDVSFSPDGNLLAAAFRSGVVKLWDAENGIELVTLTGHSNEVLSLAFDSTGSYLATGGWDWKIKVWDIKTSIATATGQEILTLSGHMGAVEELSFSPDGKRLVSVSVDSTVRVWDIYKSGIGDELAFSNGSPPGPEWMNTIALSQDGTYLAASNADITPRIWNTNTGELVRNLVGHDAPVERIEFSPDGAYVVTAGHDDRVKIWDPSNGQELLYLNGFNCEVSGAGCDVAFSPDGKNLAVVDYDGFLRVFDYQQILQEQPGMVSKASFENSAHDNFIFSVRYSPDGSKIATAGADRFVRVWDARTGENILLLGGAREFNFDAHFSPDGNQIATSHEEGFIQLWDAESGELLSSLSGHNSSVLRLAFDQDGKRIASAGSDGTVKVWDKESGEELLSIYVHRFGVSDVEFSPDGKKLYASVRDGTTRVYFLVVDDLIAFAQNRLTRTFTESECRQYLHSDICPLWTNDRQDG